jgi:hypothetical protein
VLLGRGRPYQGTLSRDHHQQCGGLPQSSPQGSKDNNGRLSHPFSCMNFSDHPGNIQLGKVVAEHGKEYDAADRAQKTNVSKNVVKIIKRNNGRFLQHDKTIGDWEEVSDSVAREKVSGGFRHTKGDGRDSLLEEKRPLNTPSAKPGSKRLKEC